MVERSCFVTLTYDDAHLPWDGSVSRREHQKFMYRLRETLKRKHDVDGIRFYMCGEYGADDYVEVEPGVKARLGPGRPHYHYLIFGWDFPDKYWWTSHRGHDYYRSEELENIWKKGFVTIGHVTTETAAYTARYVMKKITGDEELAHDHYCRIIPGREEPVYIEPEFCLMSLRPGIGSKWFEKYGYSDIYDSGDFVVIKGKKYKTPRYYDKLLQDLDERELMRIKKIRRAGANGRKEDCTPERLAVREEALELKAAKLKRGFENE